MTRPTEPDPQLALLAEIRDLLIEIRDQAKPPTVRPAAAAMPIRSEPRKQPASHRDTIG